MKHSRLALFLPLTALLAAGCTRETIGPAMFAGGLVAGVMVSKHAADERAEERAEREERYYTSPPPVVVVTRYEAAPEAVPPPPPFDAKGARGALAAIDVAKCAAEGAPRGYGHARVTFNPSGDISKVVIDEPAGLPPAGTKCIGDALGTATVPVFSGSLVTVGTTWYVP